MPKFSFDAEARSFNLARLKIALEELGGSASIVRTVGEDGMPGPRRLEVEADASVADVTVIVEAHDGLPPNTPDENVKSLRFSKLELAALFFCVDTDGKAQWIQNAIRDARSKIQAARS